MKEFWVGSGPAEQSDGPLHLGLRVADIPWVKWGACAATRGTSRPKNLQAVRLQSPVMGDQGQAFEFGLGDEHAACRSTGNGWSKSSAIQT